MIAGVGIDLVETDRIERTLKKFSGRFLNRVFTEREVEYCQSMPHPARHLAARFAAKEAVSKCLGTGIGSQLGWKDIEVLRDSFGKPLLKLHGEGLQLSAQLSVKEVHISLTHTESYGAAVAVAEK